MGIFKRNKIGRSAFYDRVNTSNFVETHEEDENVDPEDAEQPIEVEAATPAPPVARITPYEDQSGQWRWYMKLANNKKFAVSGESFASRRNCLRAANRLAELVAGSVVEEPVPVPAKTEAPAKKSAGKNAG